MKHLSSYFQGTSILIATHSVYKGLELALLHEEVGQMRLELSRLQVKEDNMEQEVNRHRRQVDLFSRPEVLDYAYNSRMPDSSSELSVYDKWFTGGQSREERGLSRHHEVSASWDGGDAGEEDGEVRNNRHIGELFQNDQARKHR